MLVLGLQFEQSEFLAVDPLKDSEGNENLKVVREQMMSEDVKAIKLYSSRHLFQQCIFLAGQSVCSHPSINCFHYQRIIVDSGISWRIYASPVVKGLIYNSIYPIWSSDVNKDFDFKAKVNDLCVKANHLGFQARAPRFSSPRPRTWFLKAKDLEIKAKDLRIGPQGPLRPRPWSTSLIWSLSTYPWILSIQAQCGNQH